MDPAGLRTDPPGAGSVVVATADRALLDAVLSVAAAAGRPAEVVPDAARLRPAWARAALLVVGSDLAEDVLAMALPRRGGVFVAGADDAADELCAWSARLGAAVAVLPGAAGSLTAAMADTGAGASGPGEVVAVRGAVGGVGVSTLAVGLAVVGARLGRRVLLVDGDAEAGGLDVVLGAEGVGGWRWPRLARVRGHLGDLSGHLPHSDGIDLLSADRNDSSPIHPEQMLAVLRSGRRSHDLVVVDLPRADTAAGGEAWWVATQPVVVVPATVRAVAAARGLLARLDSVAAPRLLVRRSRGPGLGPDTVANSLGLPLAGVVDTDPALAAAAVRGEPPARTARSPLARVCRDLLGEPSGPRRVVA